MSSESPRSGTDNVVEELEPLPAQTAGGPTALGDALIAQVHEDGSFLIGAGVRARTAASCLVSPAQGDRVLVAQSGQETFVLAVLERARADAPLPLLAGSDARIEAGTLAIEAKRELDLVAPKITLTAPALSLVGKALSFIADAVTEVFGQVRTSAQTVDMAADRIATRAHDRSTVIAGTETEQLGMLVQTVEGTASQRSFSTIIVAEEDVRMDGKRITSG